MPIFVRRKYFHPVVAQAAPAAADAFAERVVHAIRHEELRIFRPAIEPLCQPDFLLAEGIAVRCRGVLLVRGAVADDAVDDDERRLILGAQKDFDRLGKGGRVIGVAHPDHVPAVTLEPRGDVLAHGEIGMTFDGHRVAVVDPAQVRKLQMSSERGRLAGHAFH
jgi:hypothetical protein